MKDLLSFTSTEVKILDFDQVLFFIIIIIDRETSRSILFSEPYDYYYRPRDLSVYFVFGTL